MKQENKTSTVEGKRTVNEAYKTRFITGALNIEVFRTKRNEKSVNLVIYDATKIHSIVVYFTLEAMKSILEYWDLFFNHQDTPNEFAGLMLVPQKYNFDEEYQSSIDTHASLQVKAC